MRCFTVTEPLKVFYLHSSPFVMGRHDQFMQVEKNILLKVTFNTFDMFKDHLKTFMVLSRLHL